MTATNPIVGPLCGLCHQPVRSHDDEEHAAEPDPRLRWAIVPDSPPLPGQPAVWAAEETQQDAHHAAAQLRSDEPAGWRGPRAVVVPVQ